MELAQISEIAAFSNLNFLFSFTLKGETIDFNSFDCNYILDINGAYYKKALPNQECNILVVGGIDRFIHDRTTAPLVPFYITESQKIALYRLLRELAQRTDTAILRANQERLETIVTSTYNNYIG